MKAYRIRHKETGLYYRPNCDKNNLSTVGKLYSERYINNVPIIKKECFIYVSEKIYEQLKDKVDVRVYTRYYKNRYKIKCKPEDFEKEEVQ